MIKMVTATGEEHGLINTITNSCEDNDFKHCAPHIAEELRKQKKEDSRMVEVTLITKGPRTERLEKPYCRYAGDPIHQYKLIPGRTYKLPLGFIKEVNKDPPPVRSGLMEVDGERVQADGAPLSKDMSGDWQWRLVSEKF
jgi:hypothetical protein